MMTLYLVFEALDGRQISKTPRHRLGECRRQPPIEARRPQGRHDHRRTAHSRARHPVGQRRRDGARRTSRRHAKPSFAAHDDRQGARARHDPHRLSATPTACRIARQVTTARDMARARHRAARAFPAVLRLFLAPAASRYGSRRIGNHNRLLGNVRGVDGIKTGYTRASGFNLVTSAQADGRSHRRRRDGRQVRRLPRRPDAQAGRNLPAARHRARAR